MTISLIIVAVLAFFSGAGYALVSLFFDPAVLGRHDAISDHRLVTDGTRHNFTGIRGRIYESAYEKQSQKFTSKWEQYY